jgi:myosin protein heavy chain
MEQKLSNTKDMKADAERKFKVLQSQRNDMVEGHETMLDDVRDKAEDSVRRAGALLDQERTEKKRVIKDLQRARDDLEKLRIDAAQKLADQERSDDNVTSVISSDVNDQDNEITSLRDVIRKQVAEMKTLRNQTNTLRKDNKKLKAATESQYELNATITNLRDEINTLRGENTSLRSSLEDQEAINTAMDEKLASMLSKLMKEKAKSVVSRRDGQWQDSVGQVQNEKELLGRVLLRQWGREELGITDEKQGERQPYQYRYLKRERT